MVDRQGVHAVAFQIQGQIQLVLGQRFEVVGAILAGGAIHIAAIVEDEDEVLTLAHVLRALKHHVFEQVGKTRAARALVARPHVIGDRNTKNRRRMINRDDHAQAVIEFLIREFHSRELRLLRPPRLRRDEQPTEQQPTPSISFHRRLLQILFSPADDVILFQASS